MRSEKPAGRRRGGFAGAGLLLAAALVLASCAGEPVGEAARVCVEESADEEACAGEKEPTDEEERASEEESTDEETRASVEANTDEEASAGIGGPAASSSALLPASYDYRKEGRAPRIGNQGELGTCWAFASLTALSSSLLPEEDLTFSVDHMTRHNHFQLEPNEGGEYTMSMAYLLSWTGPVPEEADPYGDGISPEGLSACRHVQEIQILPSKDYEAIKRAVYLQGGVQSALYTSMENGMDESPHYNPQTNAYCYEGPSAPNHDSVIIGWDDAYPKEASSQPIITES